MFDNWDDFRFILALSEAKTLKGAAKLMKVDETTVGRRVTALELKFGARLLYKNKRHWQFTDSGINLIKILKPIEEQLVQLSTKIDGHDKILEGKVKITMPDSIANKLVLPRLAQFWNEFPNIQIEIISSAQILDLANRDADIAIRMSRPSQNALYMKKLGRMSYDLYASKNYVKKNGKRLEEYSRKHAFIDYAISEVTIQEAKWINLLREKLPSRLQVKTRQSLLGALHNDLGVAILPTYLASGEQSLVSIQSNKALSHDVWLVAHEDLKHNARIRSVADFLMRVINFKEQ